jgi:hypothetical protein
MLVPAAVLFVPMLLLFAQLEAVYGWDPLPVTQAATVTVQMKQPVRADEPPPVITLPDGFVAESPAVRAIANRQISWRVRPVREASGTLRIAARGESVSKSISAGAGLGHRSRRRVSRILDLLLHCAEWPIRSSAIEWIEVAYPASRIAVAGVEVHWSICAVIASLAGWLCLRPLQRRR